MISFCYLDKIRAGNVDKRISFIMEQLLPLANHSKKIVVQYNDLDINSTLHDRSQFLDGHLKTTIPDNCYDCPVPGAEFCTNGCWQSKAHCPKATRRDVAFSLIKFCVTASYHLV